MSTLTLYTYKMHNYVVKKGRRVTSHLFEEKKLELLPTCPWAPEPINWDLLPLYKGQWATSHQRYRDWTKISINHALCCTLHLWVIDSWLTSENVNMSLDQFSAGKNRFYFKLHPQFCYFYSCFVLIQNVFQSCVSLHQNLQCSQGYSCFVLI